MSHESGLGSYYINHMQSLLFGVCIFGHTSISIHTGPHHFKGTNTFCFFFRDAMGDDSYSTSSKISRCGNTWT